MKLEKPHPNIRIRVTAQVNLTAGQWALRTDDHSRIVIERVANSFNTRITEGFNRGDSIDDLRATFRAGTKNFGIYVTPETHDVFDSVIDTLFNRARS